MATPNAIQLLTRPNQANWTGTKKTASVSAGEKVTASGDTIYQFLIDGKEGLPKGTKIVKRDAALEFELPDGRVFQLANWCSINNSRIVDLATTTVYDEGSGKYIDGVDAISSGTCAWIGANGAAGSVGAAGVGAFWIAAAALGVGAIALAGNSNGGTAVSTPVTTGLSITGLTSTTNSGLITDQTTNRTTPSLTGKGTPGDKITVTLPNEELVTTVNANGDWTVAVTQPLPQGPVNYTVVAQAPGAAPSAPQTAVVTIDSVAPNKPTAILNSVSDSGIAGDNTTTDTTPTISGSGATAGDTITVVTPTGERLTTTVAADGTWSVEPKVAFALGAAAVQITETDPNGNVSTSTVLNLTIIGPAGTFTASVPEGPVINLAESTSNAGVPVTIALPSNAAAGDMVTVSIDGSAPVRHTITASEVIATTASVLIPTSDITAAGQGAAIVTTTYTNIAGIASPTVTTNLTIDTIAPTLDLDANNSSNAAVVANKLGLNNTGVIPDGSAALATGVLDTKYTLTAPSARRTALVADSATNLDPQWAANDLDGTDGDFSKWLGSGNSEWEGGEYRWATSFIVQPGANLSTILIKFDVAADNFLTDILVNDQSTGLALNTAPNTNNYSSLGSGHAVELSGSSNLFINGTNTITFVTYNGDTLGTPRTGQVGLRVDNLSATYLSTGGSTETNLNGFASTYVENTSPARTIVDSDVAVVETNNIQSATITLTNRQTNDVLSLNQPMPPGITASTYDAATGQLTLSGAASASVYQEALTFIVFSNADADPAANPVRNISFTLTDVAGNTSATQASTVNVVALTTSAVSITPVTIDLNGDGQIDYSQLSMDVNGDGLADKTAWVGANDGVLVWDKNANGQVIDASQYEFSRYGGTTDLSGLAAGFDSNPDGVFDNLDARFAEFAIWQDANQNGISEVGEVLNLDSLGITSIALNADLVTEVRADGVEVLGLSKATLDNGKTLLIEDAKFSYVPSTPSVFSDLDLLLAANQG
jgi:hypothetical protein